MLEKANLPLGILMSMSMLEMLWTIGLSVVSLVVLGIKLLVFKGHNSILVVCNKFLKMLHFTLIIE